MNINKIIGLDLRDVARWKRPVFEYASLDELFASNCEILTGVHSVPVSGLYFDFLVNNRSSQTTIVSLHPAFPDREGLKLPMFVGQNITGVTTNTILISDPALYCDPKLRIGWFSGTRSVEIQIILTAIIDFMFHRMGSKRNIFTGVSGGGFAALYFSSRFPGSLCIPINPQTSIAEFKWNDVMQYLRCCFGIVSNEEGRSLLESRPDTNLVSLYSHGVGNFVVYLQNESDHHVVGHERPFIAALPIDAAKRIIFVHGNWGFGHIGPPPDDIGHLLASAASWQGDWKDYLQHYNFDSIGVKQKVFV